MKNHNNCFTLRMNQKTIESLILLIRNYGYILPDRMFSSKKSQGMTNGVLNFLFVFIVLSIAGCGGSSGNGSLAPENELPTAEIVSPSNDTQFYTNVSIQFTGDASDSDGTIESYHWDFGDGYSSSVQNPIHIYTDANSYTVALRVTDDNGDTEYMSITLIIKSELIDSDGDGWTDKDEEDSGTDPANKFSWDYSSGSWPDFSDSAAGISGTGYEPNDIISDIALTDQYGHDVSMYQFYGYVILLNFSTGWCAPCRATAETYQAMWAEERESGFIVIQMIIGNDAGASPDPEWMTSWANQYGIEFPVLNSYNSSIWLGASGSSLYEGGLPFSVLLDKDMSIDSGYTGSGSEAVAFNRAKELLNQ